MNKNKKASSGGLTKKHWFGYMFGDWGGCMTFALMASIFSMYCTNVLSIDPIVMGVLSIIWTIWDAVNDPLIGTLIDRDKRKYKIGKYKTYIFIGACGLLVGGAAVFLPFPNAGTVLKSVLFILGYVIWDAAYTMANVPYGTMLNIVTDNNEERAQLSVFRSIGGAIEGNTNPCYSIAEINTDNCYWHVAEHEICTVLLSS